MGCSLYYSDHLPEFFGDAIVFDVKSTNVEHVTSFYSIEKYDREPSEMKLRNRTDGWINWNLESQLNNFKFTPLSSMLAPT